MYSQSLHSSGVPRSTTPPSAAPRSIESLCPRFRLYDDTFAQDPHRVYAQMRAGGRTLVPVLLAEDVPATLVIGYDTALRILNDDDRFPADPRVWQKTVRPDHPLLPMMEWRPNPLRNGGDVHGRYRRVLKDALSVVDLHAVRHATAAVAIPLMNRFCREGKADLISQYITPTVFGVLNTEMLGCPAEIGGSVMQAAMAMFDATDTTTVESMLGQSLGQLMASKTGIHPDTDVTARLVHNATDLSHEEKLNQLVTLLTAGLEVPRNHIANTVLLMLTDPRYRPDSTGFAPLVSDAAVEILLTDPPMANYCISYPPGPVLIDGVWLPADEPVVISLAACNNDPALRANDLIKRANLAGDWHYGGGNGWHLAYATGRHACPAMARQASELIVVEAITQLFDVLPELELAVPRQQLTWRPGPFHRALTALPVVFPPRPPLTVPPVPARQ